MSAGGDGVKRLGHVPLMLVENDESVRDLAQAAAKQFGVQVKNFRIARRWTQDEFASRMSAAGYPMHQTTVAKVESASRPTSVEEALAIAAVLGVESVEDLFVGSSEMEALFDLAAKANELAAIAGELADMKHREGLLKERYEKLASAYEQDEITLEKMREHRRWLRDG